LYSPQFAVPLFNESNMKLMMKRRNLLLLLLTFAFTASITAQSNDYPKREFRAAWIQTVNGQYRGMSTAAMQKSLIDQLNSLQADGINAIIFQVRPESDALYQSNLEPWSRYPDGRSGTGARTPYWDPLQFMDGGAMPCTQAGYGATCVDKPLSGEDVKLRNDTGAHSYLLLRTSGMVHQLTAVCCSIDPGVCLRTATWICLRRSQRHREPIRHRRTCTWTTISTPIPCCRYKLVPDDSLSICSQNARGYTEQRRVAAHTTSTCSSAMNCHETIQQTKAVG
jgi:hypothetical protein